MAYVENAPHNPEVVGSNPAPATKNLQLVGYVGELFYYRLCLRAYAGGPPRIRLWPMLRALSAGCRAEGCQKEHHQDVGDLDDR